ncbi:MAG: FAD-dependent oxidoreductase [Peptostreptococcaceae bacterium]|nr:FAD-dependent oxidoreductase [Peptostreptococcaceae bacterium]
MNRREFYKNSGMLGLGLMAGSSLYANNLKKITEPGFFEEEAKKLPSRHFDVVVAGGGTSGVIAAIASARQGAKTVLVENKGYVGGTVVEGGTALHSFYNLWKAFPGVEKRQLIKGIPAEMVDRLTKRGGATGYAEMVKGYEYDSVCTAIDTEMYKLNAFEMLDEAGVYVCVNTLLAGVINDKNRVKGVILESRSGREVIFAKSFIDCTGYADLAAHAGAEFTEPNDHEVANSMGLGNVDIEKYYQSLSSQNAVGQLAYGVRSGEPGQIIRLGSEGSNGYPEAFVKGARKIGMSAISTTTQDNYLMFIKLNLKLEVSPTNRDEVSKAELELRKRMQAGVVLFKEHIPGFEKAFITRTSPSLCIRRGRLITCDYDITHENVLNGDHFEDDVYVYGFHDMAPKYQVKNGGSYGVPYRALCVKNIENLYVSGMMITSDHNAHMSTRNTVSCMGMGQASGTAAALCALGNMTSRELSYSSLRKALEKGNVYFE